MTVKDVDVYIDGQPLDLSQTNGFGEFSLIFRDRTSDGDSGVSFSSDVDFYGAAFEAIKSKIIDAPSPHLSQMTLEIVSKCCLDGDKNRVLFTGKIAGDSVQWCQISSEGECQASAAIIDNSQKAKILERLKNTDIWDKKERANGAGLTKGENEFRAAPFVVYADAPRTRGRGLFDIFVAWCFLKIVLPLFNAFIKIVNRFNELLDKVGLSKIDLDDSFLGGLVNAMQSVIESLGEAALGLGRKHKAPFIHSYLENLCAVNGLTLSSNVFGVGAPYHNLMRLDCPNREGARGGVVLESAWNANKPNLNGLQFLDGLQKDLELKWWIDGQVLNVHFDHDSGQVFFDMEGNESEIVELCFEITKARPKAKGLFEYTQDGIDGHGDSVRHWWAKAMDFGTPTLAAQSGLLQKTIPYGAARFRKEARENEELPIDGAEWIDRMPQLAEYKNALVLTDGTAAYPKLLLWDGQSDLDAAKVWRKQITADGFDYNVPMWFVDKYDQDQNQVTGYQSFFQKNDPTLGGYKARTYTLRLAMTCEKLGKMSLQKAVRLKVGQTFRKGTIEEIALDFEAGEVIVKGEI